MKLHRLLIMAGILTSTVGCAFAGAGDAGPADFGGVGSADTLRTNLWLAQALMGEIVREAAAALPAPPASLLLAPQQENAGNELFSTVAARILEDLGYTLYVRAAAEKDTTASAPAAVTAAYEMRYDLQDTRLEYPAIGRRFGIWRQWVAREMEFAAMVTVVETETGRLLLKDLITRSYRDRVTSQQFPVVDSQLYPFTGASLQESGWRRRLEEIVVLGTLTGLVAIYFANTGE